jgi:hypothetical protein
MRVCRFEFTAAEGCRYANQQCHFAHAMSASEREAWRAQFQAESQEEPKDWKAEAAHLKAILEEEQRRTGVDVLADSTASQKKAAEAGGDKAKALTAAVETLVKAMTSAV